MANDVKDTEIKFRLSIDKKEEFKKCADEVGLSMSDFIRSLIFGKEKLVFLSEGSEIAKELYLVRKDLEYFRDNGGIPKESLEALTGAFENMITKLNAVSEKLTNIHADSEEADSDE